MSKEENKAVFEKQTWTKGDRPGASDFNRIEEGIESAHGRINQMEQVIITNQASASQALSVTFPFEAISEIVKQIPKLENGAKVADVVVAFNALHDALTQHVELTASEVQD